MSRSISYHMIGPVKEGEWPGDIRDELQTLEDQGKKVVSVIPRGAFIVVYFYEPES